MISISRTLFNQDGDDVSLELHVDEVGEEDQDPADRNVRWV
jgi:hypothetical protein